MLGSSFFWELYDDAVSNLETSRTKKSEECEDNKSWESELRHIDALKSRIQCPG